MTMKCLLLLSAICATIYAQLTQHNADVAADTKRLFQQTIRECQQTTNASDEDAINYMAKKPSTSHEGKCLVFCAHRKFNLQTEEARINADGFRQVVATLTAIFGREYRAKMQASVAKCSQIDIKSDPCQTAEDLYVCYCQEAAAVSFTLAAQLVVDT